MSGRNLGLPLLASCQQRTFKVVFSVFFLARGVFLGGWAEPSTLKDVDRCVCTRTCGQNRMRGVVRAWLGDLGTQFGC